MWNDRLDRLLRVLALRAEDLWVHQGRLNRKRDLQGVVCRARKSFEERRSGSVADTSHPSDSELIPFFLVRKDGEKVGICFVLVKTDFLVLYIA